MIAAETTIGTEGEENDEKEVGTMFEVMERIVTEGETDTAEMDEPRAAARTEIGSVDEMDIAMKGVTALAIVVGASPYSSPALQRAVEFTGVENQVSALAAGGGGAPADLRVVLCSSMGTTEPNPSPGAGGSILFWKLNAEAFLGASGIGSVVVKPCGLDSRQGGSSTLLVGHDDTLIQTNPPLVARADVAAVMAEAIATRAAGLRFDLCSRAGSPTTDLGALLTQAAYPWQRAWADRSI